MLRPIRSIIKIQFCHGRITGGERKPSKRYRGIAFAHAEITLATFPLPIYFLRFIERFRDKLRDQQKQISRRPPRNADQL